MIETGVLGEDTHVQLVAGALVAMTPQGPAHARLVHRLTRLLVRAVSDDLAVLPQLPLTLLEDSEPEPDLAVVRADEAGSRDHHPRSALLVIEIAGDSLRIDRETKASLYARAGVPEYWIVNLAESLVEVHRDPDPSGVYRSKVVVRRGELLASPSVPGLTVDVDALFA